MPLRNLTSGGDWILDPRDNDRSCSTLTSQLDTTDRRIPELEKKIGQLLVDSTQFPGQPVLFVAVLACRQSVSKGEMPLRPEMIARALRLCLKRILVTTGVNPSTGDNPRLTHRSQKGPAISQLVFVFVRVPGSNRTRIPDVGTRFKAGSNQRLVPARRRAASSLILEAFGKSGCRLSKSCNSSAAASCSFRRRWISANRI